MSQAESRSINVVVVVVVVVYFQNGWVKGSNAYNGKSAMQNRKNKIFKNTAISKKAVIANSRY